MDSRKAIRVAGRSFALIAGAAVLVLLARSVLGGRAELTDAARALTHPAAVWVAVAIGAEASSYLLYASAQRRLLGRAVRPPGVGWLGWLAVAAQGLNNFVPGGYVFANLLNFRELRHRQIPAFLAGWLLLVTSTLYIGALATLAILGSQIAGDTGPASDVRYGLFAAIGLAGAVGAVAWALARRGRMPSVPLPAIGGRWIRRLRPPGGWRERLLEVRVSKRRLASAGVLLMACWLADLACLIAAFFAVGATPPWQSLLLAYAGGQLVSFLPLTPGGVGLVEGTLAAGLGGLGGHADVLAAVLLFRLISYWGTLPAGVAGYAVVRVSGSRLAEAPPDPLLEPA